MIRLLIGDCREMLATLPDRSVQTCVTSPPYFGLRDYGCDGQIGFEPTPDAYVAELVAVFREVRRVLRDDGTLWLNLGDSYASGGTIGRNDTGPEDIARRAAAYGTGTGSGSAIKAQGQRKPVSGYKPKDLLGIPWLVAFALRADGWYLRQDIIWAKPNPMPESVTDRCTKAHEYVFLLSKSARYFWDAKAIAEPAVPQDRTGKIGYLVPKHQAAVDDGIRTHGGPKSTLNGPSRETRNKRSVWTIATQPYSGAHFATMPPDLAETCINAGSSERGQCPHCGAPWVRQIETVSPSSWESRKAAGHKGGIGGSIKLQREYGATMDFDNRAGGFGSPSIQRQTGWAPSCACPEHQPVPQVVLDPFGGAGTTALVADRLQRDAVMIELNPAYADLGLGRVIDDAGLFAEVAAE